MVRSEITTTKEVLENWRRLVTFLLNSPTDLSLNIPTDQQLDDLAGGKSCTDCSFSLNISRVSSGGVHYQECIHHFSLVPFPGCCGIVVSIGAYTNTAFRHKGINTISNIVRQKIADILGYSLLICTNRTDNEAERRTLLNNGFTDLLVFRNHRTGNEIAISSKEIKR